MPSRLTERELLDHIKGYNDQMVEITEKTAAQVQALKDATKIVNDQKDSNWKKYKPIIMVVVYVAAILIVLYGARQLGYCSVSLESLTKGGAQRCEQKTL